MGLRIESGVKMRRLSEFKSVVVFTGIILILGIAGCGRSRLTREVKLYVTQAKAAFNKKNYEPAIEHLREALNLVPRTDRRYAEIYEMLLASYDQWGIDSVHEGDTKSAIIYFKKEISLLEEAKVKINPLRPGAAHVNLAMAYYWAGSYEQSIASAEKSLTFPLKDKNFAYFMIGRCYSAKGDFDKAQEYADKLRELEDPDAAAEIEAEMHWE